MAASASTPLRSVSPHPSPSDWFDEKLKDPEQLASFHALLEEDDEEDEVDGVDGKTYIEGLIAELETTGRISPL